MKKLFKILAATAAIIIAPVMVASAITTLDIIFMWDYDQVTSNADVVKFTLYECDSEGNNKTHLLDIPYDGLGGVDYHTTAQITMERASTDTYFVMTASDSGGNESVNSEVVMYHLDLDPPTAPFNLRITVRIVN